MSTIFGQVMFVDGELAPTITTSALSHKIVHRRFQVVA